MKEDIGMSKLKSMRTRSVPTQEVNVGPKIKTNHFHITLHVHKYSSLSLLYSSVYRYSSRVIWKRSYINLLCSY